MQFQKIIVYKIPPVYSQLKAYYVFTINLFTIAESCTEKWIIL